MSIICGMKHLMAGMYYNICYKEYLEHTYWHKLWESKVDS